MTVVLSNLLFHRRSPNPIKIPMNALMLHSFGLQSNNFAMTLQTCAGLPVLSEQATSLLNECSEWCCVLCAQVAVEQDAWKAAMARARGERVLDDPKLLSR